MNHSWIAVWRGRIAAASCLLMLLSSLLPAHAALNVNAPNVTPAVPGQAIILMMRAGDEPAPARSDAMVHHACQPCPCQAAVLPALALTPVLSIRPITFTLALPPFSRPGTLVPPSEPPRA